MIELFKTFAIEFWGWMNQLGVMPYVYIAFAMTAIFNYLIAPLLRGDRTRDAYEMQATRKERAARERRSSLYRSIHSSRMH